MRAATASIRPTPRTIKATFLTMYVFLLPREEHSTFRAKRGDMATQPDSPALEPGQRPLQELTVGHRPVFAVSRYARKKKRKLRASGRTCVIMIEWWQATDR